MGKILQHYQIVFLLILQIFQLVRIFISSQMFYFIHHCVFIHMCFAHILLRIKSFYTFYKKFLSRWSNCTNVYKSIHTNEYLRMKIKIHNLLSLRMASTNQKQTNQEFQCLFLFSSYLTKVQSVRTSIASTIEIKHKVVFADSASKHTSRQIRFFESRKSLLFLWVVGECHWCSGHKGKKDT